MSNKSRFVWHDLNTRDVDGAKRFYGELFNWSFEKSDNGPYQHIKTGAEMIGGVRQMEASERVPPNWLGYISVDDVPATVAAATAHGGKVYMPTTAMPNVGTFAVVADPTGGVVAPWRSARPEEDQEPTAPTPMHAFCWDELLTLDPAAAAKFYTSVFGWGTESQDMGPMGTYTLFTRPGVKNRMQPDKEAWAGGMMQAPPTVPHSFWLAYVQVEDTDVSAERAKKLGATVVVPPTDIPNIGRFCAFMDPANAALAFISFPKP
jgi:hypothetical protein